jgi:hypothetical protein
MSCNSPSVMERRRLDCNTEIVRRLPTQAHGADTFPSVAPPRGYGLGAPAPTPPGLPQLPGRLQNRERTGERSSDVPLGGRGPHSRDSRSHYGLAGHRLGNCGVAGRSSLSSVQAGGMRYTSQCTKVPEGASGSSMIRAKLLVVSGAPVQARGGEMFPPSFEYLLGITPSSWKARLVSFKFMMLPGMHAIYRKKVSVSTTICSVC